MPRRRVEFRAGEFYHVYNRGNNHQRIFLEPENYLFFLRKLRVHIAATVASVAAYCLMPNHFHLLLRLNADDLSEHMQAFSLSYTKAINRGYRRDGTLFQGRFHAIHVDSGEYLLHLSRYIHLNPVEARLVARPQDWEYSSYPEYIGQRNGTLPQVALVLHEFGPADRYRQFVEGGIGLRDSLIAHLTIDE